MAFNASHHFVAFNASTPAMAPLAVSLFVLLLVIANLFEFMTHNNIILLRITVP